MAAQPALASVTPDVDALVALFASLAASVDALELALSYASFHPVRLADLPLPVPLPAAAHRL